MRRRRWLFSAVVAGSVVPAFFLFHVQAAGESGAVLLPERPQAEEAAPTGELKTVTLANGNRMQGYVVQTSEDALTLRIPDIGEVRLEHREIASVETAEQTVYRHLVTLKNQNQIFGAVTENEKGIRIDMPGIGVLEFRHDEVEHIVDLDPAQAEALEQAYRERATEAPEETLGYYSESDDLDAHEAELARVFEAQRKEIEQRVSQTQSLAMQSRLEAVFGKSGDGAREEAVHEPAAEALHPRERFLRAIMALGGWLYLGLFFIGIYYAYGLQTIAAKTGTDKDWMAWVPFLHIYLACRCGGRPGYWLLLYIVPGINLVADVLVWKGICESRGKPKPMALMACVPVLNGVLLGYVAYSD